MEHLIDNCSPLEGSPRVSIFLIYPQAIARAIDGFHFRKVFERYVEKI